MRRKIEKIDGAVYGRGYVYNLHYHMVWATKYRNQVFVSDQLVDEMKDILQFVADENDIIIEEMEVMPDHVHVMLLARPQMSPTNIAKILKGRTAALFFQKHPDIKKQKFWGGHLWSNSYYIGTVGNMSKETVRKYIESQYVKKPNSSHN